MRNGVHIVSGTPGRLEYFVGSPYGFIEYVMIGKLSSSLVRLAYFNLGLRTFAGVVNRDHAKCGITKRKLLIALKIVIDDNRSYIMNLNKRPEADIGVELTMFFKMRQQHRRLQQVVEACKGEHVDRDKKYAADALHRLKVLKRRIIPH